MKIFVAGHNGMVGSSVYRELKKFNNIDILTVEKKILDLTNQQKTYSFIKKNKPDFVIICAAKVGGIFANMTQPTEFFYQNIMIEMNLINASLQNNVENLFFLGSSCVYPNNIDKKINTTDLMKGPLEKTNEPYALAKISGIKFCEYINRQFNKNYICLMPTNLYGLNDTYNDKHSHVIPALINRIYNAMLENQKFVSVWGSGKVKREFLFSSDLGKAIVFLMKKSKNYKLPNLINIGSDSEISISELASLIKKIIGYKGEIVHDTNYPDGTLRKHLNSNYIFDLGWRPKISLENGLKKTIKDFMKNKLR